MIYLDNAATTPLAPEVVEAMLPYFTTHFGNPSSVHAVGREARAAVEHARESVAALFGADPGEIVFTSGGTEADNLALLIALHHQSRHGRTGIVTSSAEHHAVLSVSEWHHSHGSPLHLLPVHDGGCVDAAELTAALDDGTAVVSLMHVNNETGAMHDLPPLAEAAHAGGALFHTDAVQSAGKHVLDVHGWGIDLACASAHKIHGPKGIGALFIRRGLQTEPLIRGGSQERGRRGGTENVALIVGFGEAARLALAQRGQRLDAWKRQRAMLIEQLRGAFPKIMINGSDDAVSPNITSISFPSSTYTIDGEALLYSLDLDGLAVSSGSACTAGSIEPSHVMCALGHDTATAAATLRVSFGAQTTDDEIFEGTEILVRTVQRMLAL